MTALQKVIKYLAIAFAVFLTFNKHFVRNVRNEFLYGMFGMFETVKNKMTNVRNNLKQIIKILFGMFGIILNKCSECLSMFVCSKA